MQNTRLAAVAAVLGALFAPAVAHAQYKNASFGFDLGGWLLQKPSIIDPATNRVYEDTADRPMRLSNGGVLGGETNFKLDADHWWFTGRVNVGFLLYAGDEPYDEAAREALGTLMAIEGMMGIRYFIFTDRVRPYLQLSLSYLRLMSFKSTSGAECSAEEAVYCATGTNSDNYLPHPNVGGVHLRPGVEFIFARDKAIHLFVDGQRWIVYNAPDNWAFVVGLGIILYT